MPEREAYLGNPNLQKANVEREYTKAEIVEIQKCMDNPVYFIEHYFFDIKIRLYQFLLY